MGSSDYDIANVIDELAKIKLLVESITSELAKLPCKEHMQLLTQNNIEFAKINERFLTEERLEAKRQRLDEQRRQISSQKFDKLKLIITPFISSAFTILIYLIVENFIKK